MLAKLSTAGFFSDHMVQLASLFPDSRDCPTASGCHMVSPGGGGGPSSASAGLATIYSYFLIFLRKKKMLVFKDF